MRPLSQKRTAGTVLVCRKRQAPRRGRHAAEIFAGMGPDLSCVTVLLAMEQASLQIPVQHHSAGVRSQRMVSAAPALTSFATLRHEAERSGFDLAHSLRMKHEPAASIVQSRTSREMNPVALLTPTYGRDLELCKLLCESVDRHVSSFAKHYLLVPDADLSLFAPLQRGRREVIAASSFLPDWLRPLPRIIQRKRRQYWWSFRTKPVSGWHVQQYLKIAATMSLPYRRYCILDSDIVFFRDFDLAPFQLPHPIPLFGLPDEVVATQPRHSRWVETSHRLLGLPPRPLPASDFIGHIIFWDRQTTAALVAQIEAVTNLHWIEALCRTREFSEYMLYGYFVQNNARFSSVHRPTSSTQCVSYWEQLKLDKDELNGLLRGANKDDVAFSIASFSGTPVETMRAAMKEHEAARAPQHSSTQAARLGALC